MKRFFRRSPIQGREGMERERERKEMEVKIMVLKRRSRT